jgi:hypothetical protein
MTIFIIGSVEDTADELDYRRFNKQILECQWIIDMAEGRTKPSNHPAYLMYKDHIEWVKLYRDAFIAYRENFQYDIVAKDSVQLTAPNVGQVLYYLAQATEGLEVTQEEVVVTP